MDARPAGTTPLLVAPDVTVAEVLAMDEVRAGQPRVVAGRDHLDQAVRWVHIAEVPDIAKLLKGGELVLTTGIALPDEDDGLAGYVQELAEAGASGLAVELVRRYTEMPRQLVDAAERCGLPLIALEGETPFVAITEAVHAKILHTQLAELRVKETVHRALHGLAARATLGDVVRKLSELAHCPVVFENLAHKPLAVASHSVPLEDLLAGWEERSRRLDDSQPGWFAAPVEPRGQPCGRVVLLLEQQCEALHRAVLDIGAETLAVVWLVSGPPSSLEHAAQRELIEDVAALRCRSINEVYVRAQSLGVMIRHQRLASLCVRSDHPFCPVELVSHALEATGSTGLVARTREDQVHALVALPEVQPGPQRAAQPVPQRVGQPVPQRVGQIAAEVRHGFTGPPESLAFGSALLPEHPTLEDLARSLAQADEAARAVLGSGDQRVMTIDDIELPGLLRLLADDARVQRFVSNELHRLWDYDELHGTRLLEILTVYLESGGNKSVAAAHSHLSRAAFYHSLDRLEAVLQRDLELPEVRTALHVAILASADGRRRPQPRREPAVRRPARQPSPARAARAPVPPGSG